MRGDEKNEALDKVQKEEAMTDKERREFEKWLHDNKIEIDPRDNKAE